MAMAKTATSDDVIVQLEEVDWQRLQELRAGEPLYINAGERLVIVASDHHADDVVAALEESLGDVTVIENGDGDG